RVIHGLGSQMSEARDLRQRKIKMNQRTRNIAVAGLVVLVGVAALVYGLTSNAPPKLTTPAPACQPDPAAQIAALPPGGTFPGHGCYVTSGITITKPVTINGAESVESIT